MLDDGSHTDRRSVLKYLGSASVTGSVALAGCTSDQQGGSSGGMQQITALGGITGGSGYQQCLVFQQILHENFDDVRVTVSGTDGWKADAKLMWSQGNAEFGIVPAGDAYNILHGNDPYGEERNYILQAYPAVPPTYLHVVVRKDGDIQEYADLEGKRINVLSRGSLTNAIQPRVMDALGYEPEEYLHYPHQEAAGALKQGDIDAVVGAGVAAPYQEMSQQMPVEVVSLSESEKEPINEGIPWLGFTTVDFSEYYNGASESLVPAPWTVMACQKSLDEDFVYETVKTVFDNVDLASQIYDPASQLDPSLAPKTRVPVHPGAYRYYQEQNVEIPDELQPPESLPLSE